MPLYFQAGNQYVLKSLHHITIDNDGSMLKFNYHIHPCGFFDLNTHWERNMHYLAEMDGHLAGSAE